VDVTATVGGRHLTGFLASATGASGDSRARYAPPAHRPCKKQDEILAQSLMIKALENALEGTRREVRA
jgi:hypothetical protein